jgi:predicted enzyme related to lactoylglutathione lyase
MVEVDDLDRAAGTLREAGAHFRSPIIEGVGGRQVLVDDPSGNPVELFSPLRDEARLKG